MTSSISPARSRLRVNSLVPLTLLAAMRLTVSSFSKVCWLRGITCVITALLAYWCDTGDKRRTPRQFPTAIHADRDGEWPLEGGVFLPPMQLEPDFVGSNLVAAPLCVALALLPVGNRLLGLLELAEGSHDLVPELIELGREVRDRLQDA